MSDQFGPLLDRDAAPERAGFRNELWSTLADGWQGIETTDVTFAGPADGSATVTPLDAVRQRRRRTIWVATGLAAVAATVAAVVLTSNAGQTTKVIPGIDPSVPEVTVTSPRPTTAVEPAPTVTAAPAPMSWDGVPVTRVVNVDTPTVELQRDVLYSASIGAADDQFGFEECGDCDNPQVSGVVSVGDSLVVTDVAKSRLVTIVDGRWVPTAPPAGISLDGSLLVTDGQVAVVVRKDGEPGQTIQVLDAAGLSAGQWAVLEEIPNPAFLSVSDLLPKPTSPVVEPHFDREAATLLTGTTTWTIELPITPGGAVSGVLANNHVFVDIFRTDPSTETTEYGMLELSADGSARIGWIPGSRGYYSHPSITADGAIVQFEGAPGTVDIVRYRFPAVTSPVEPAPPVTASAVAPGTEPTTPADPPTPVATQPGETLPKVDISGPWTTFEQAMQRYNGLPGLSPSSTGALPGLTMSRTWPGGSGYVEPGYGTGYRQMFRSVDARTYLELLTTPTPGGGQTDDSGWTMDGPRPMIDGVSALIVSNTAGSVQLWSSGLTRAELEEIAGRLTKRTAPEAGWEVIGGIAGLAPFAEEWMAVNWGPVDWRNADGDLVGQMLIGVAGIGAERWIPYDPVPPAIVTINGREVVLFETTNPDGTLSIDAVWVIPGVIPTPAILRVSGQTREDVLALVGSWEMTEGSDAWNAIPVGPEPTSDGCTGSLFC